LPKNQPAEMNSLKSLCLLILIAPFFATVNAQIQEYVVTTKGDTLKGEVKLLTYDRLDRAQVTINKTKTLLSALQVKSVFEKGQFYRTVQIENSIQFMKILKDGYLSLLAFRLPGVGAYDGRYLSKKDGSGMEVPNLGFKKLISNYLSDCPQTVGRINEEKFKRGDIEKIIDDYNGCINEKTQVVRQVNEVNQTNGEKSDAVNALRSKVTTMEDFSQKQDVLDLLNDISDKVSRQQAIPNYQLETLKSLLREKDSVKEELEKVISLVTKI
jgi:hypothetical protein